MRRLAMAVLFVTGIAVLAQVNRPLPGKAVAAPGPTDVLYLCEGEGANGDTCLVVGRQDDHGADEELFEGREVVSLGTSLIEHFDAHNPSSTNWDISAISKSVVTLNDPGSDCSATPSLELLTLIGQNDNHAALPSDPEAVRRSGLSDWDRVHVQALDSAEPMRLVVSLPASPAGCSDAVWSFSVQLSVLGHPVAATDMQTLSGAVNGPTAPLSVGGMAEEPGVMAGQGTAAAAAAHRTAYGFGAAALAVAAAFGAAGWYVQRKRAA